MIDLDHELDELYGVELPGFVARRNALAKELRAQGRNAASQRVKELRKPPRSVWIVNQLARRQRREVDLLLDSGHRAREAQREVLGGKKADLDRALAQEREALATLLAAARELLPNASPAMIERVSQTLRAAAVTDAGREQLARGRLEQELGPIGFDALS
jgi:hypothetical protein